MLTPEMLVGLVIGLFGGVAASVVTFRLKARREDTVDRRAKLEELHRCFHRVADGLGVMWITRGAPARHGSIKVEEKHPTGEAFETLESLVTLYFPELDDHLVALRGMRDRCGRAMAAQMTARQAREDNERALEIIGECAKELPRVKAAFDGAVRRAARAIR